ncbi:hypothetical protein [[Clostridium] colinum]|nr:hypothetical protein [[Clostridium] colinum]
MFELGLYIGVLVTGIFTYLGYLLCEIKHKRKFLNKYKGKSLDIPKFLKR